MHTGSILNRYHRSQPKPFLCLSVCLDQRLVWRLAAVLSICCFHRIASAQHGSAEQAIERFRHELTAFQHSFYGMSFALKTVRLDGAVFNEGMIWISRDGKICKSELMFPGADHRVRSGTISNGIEGWLFIASQREPQVDASVSSAVIEYFDPTHVDVAINSIFSDLPFGFVEGRTFDRFVNESSLNVHKEIINGVAYEGLNCDHPQLCSVVFLFDSDERLRFVKVDYGSGDRLPGSQDGSDRVLQTHQWIKRLIGPIEYAVWEDRLVPCEFPTESSSSEFDKAAGNTRFFSEFTTIPADIDGRIEFSNVSLNEGMRVTKFGEHWIRHELRDGRVVKIADSNALAAADQARMGGFIRSRIVWYVGLCCLLVGVIALLCWQRAKVHQSM